MMQPAAALDLGEVARRLANIIRPGTIAETDLSDPKNPRARVQYADGPVLTGWLPWMAAAGEDRDWRPPSIGEQALVLSPYGEMSAGWILPGAYRDKFPAPSGSPSVRMTAYRDGAIVSYDSDSHELSAVLPDGGTASIAAPGGLSVTGDTEVAGDLAVEGDLSVTGDIAAGGNVSDATGSMAEMRRVFNLHTHGTPPAVTVPPPNQRMT